MKMAVNLMLGSAMAAYSEALVLGESLGLSRQMMAEVLLEAPVFSPSWYLAHNAEALPQLAPDDLLGACRHWLCHGLWLGLASSPAFQLAVYKIQKEAGIQLAPSQKPQWRMPATAPWPAAPTRRRPPHL